MNTIFFQGISQNNNKTITIHFDGLIDGVLKRSSSYTAKKITIDFEKNIIVADDIHFDIVNRFGEFNEYVSSLGFSDNFCKQVKETP